MANGDDIDTIVTIDNPTAAVRMLDSAPSNFKEWITPEFISLLSTVAVNLLTAAVVIGWVDATQAQELSKAVTTILTAVSTISVNGMIVWKFLAGRQAVQVEKITAQYRYATAVVHERMVAAERKAVKPRGK